MFKPAAVLTTDLHLSEKPEDQYRFELFPWLVKQYATRATTVIISGDLTDRKDRHADWFVNKVVEYVGLLGQSFQVYLLRGNHDCHEDPNEPFFRFLSGIPNVTFIVEPRRLLVPFGKTKKRIFFLPHSRHPEKEWGGYDFKDCDAIFMHQTFRGAISESGRKLDGLNPGAFKDIGCPIFSGDIHVPQQVGPITYIGCPWHVHFGDKFKPRIVLADADLRLHDGWFPAPQKLVVDVAAPGNLQDSRHHIQEGDRCKVRLHLPRSEFVEWPKHRDRIKVIAKELKIELHGIELKELVRTRLPDKKAKATPSVSGRTRLDTFQQYCKSRAVDERMVAIGRELLL